MGIGKTEWSWQKAGQVVLPAGENTISLHDLTGFCGRCQAVFLTADETLVPPDDESGNHEFRSRYFDCRIQDDSEEYDLIVAGGGYAGVCTAFAAAKTGSKVLIMNDRGVLGGCNSSEIRVALGGGCCNPPFPNLGRVVDLFAPICGGPVTYPAEFYEDFRKTHIFHSTIPASACRLLLYERVVKVEMADERKIAAVISRNVCTGVLTRHRAELFSDCTGDGVIAIGAGCTFMYGREARSDFNETLAPEIADKMIMGHSVLWYSEEMETEQVFPEIDWGIPFTEENVIYKNACVWEWETGMTRDQIKDIEYIRDYGMMTLLCNWSYIKNHSERKDEWSKRKLVWASPLGGKREGIRVYGDYVMTQNDVEDSGISYPDETGCLTWNIDLHLPDPKNVSLFSEPFISCAYHRGFRKMRPVPYRCLYSKDVDNLFLGGRLLSMTHVAFAVSRVMRTLGVLGEAAGLAASLCKEYGISPRELGKTHYPELRQRMEQGVPYWRPHDYSPTPSESYHFHDLGFCHTWDQAKMNDPEIASRVSELHVTHIADEKK